LAWIPPINKIKWKYLFDLNGCLSDQHLRTTMQILYVANLQLLKYVQHTYAVIGNTCRFVHKCF
jgi:hypothetical protein